MVRRQECLDARCREYTTGIPDKPQQIPMRVAMRALVLVYMLILAAVSPIRTAGAQLGPAHGGQRTATRDTSLARQFAGCYRLTVNRGPAYRVRLLTQSRGPAWLAQSLDSARGANTPGNEWSWMPLNTARILISWSGVDSAMEFELTRRASGWAATGILRTGNSSRSEQRMLTVVRRIQCP